jgi:hypothetical protein
MNSIEHVEKSISDFLLRDVIFYIDGGKTLKKGKLILFKFKEFYFNFTIKNDKDVCKVFEIPYPFKHDCGVNFIKFSYNIDDMVQKNSNLYFKIKMMNTSNISKLYNSVLVLSAV